jgi:glycosyltransferase involved in cell wall biosynthesis
MSTGAPVASIIVVSDYKVGAPESLDQLRLTLEGLARQDYREPVEFLFVESAQASQDVPAAVLDLLPGLKVVHTEGSTSYDLKNAGARAASSDFVILLDADCAPHPDWWRSVIEHRRQYPEAAAISGRTMYKGEGLLPRVLALLDRSYVDPGRPGPTRAISNNNAGFRRNVLLEYPLQNEVGAFGSRPHADQIMAAGGELRFEPGMVAYHGFGGWPMEQHDRQQIGFSMTRYRQLNPEARHSWMFRMGYGGIPLILGMSTLGSWRRCLRLASGYGVRWFEVPIACAMAVRAHVMEIPGILLAMRGESIGAGNAYR